jgi:hypothetical protein
MQANWEPQGRKEGGKNKPHTWTTESDKHLQAFFLKRSKDSTTIHHCRCCP